MDPTSVIYTNLVSHNFQTQDDKNNFIISHGEFDFGLIVESIGLAGGLMFLLVNFVFGPLS